MVNKKILTCFVVGVFALSSVFALDLSVGGGFSYNNTGFTAKNKDIEGSVKQSFSMIGVHGFFDAQYVTANLGLNFKAGAVKITDGDKTAELKDLSLTDVNLAFWGKYPFSLGIAKLYPMLGFEFDFNASAKYDGKKLKKEVMEEWGLGNRYYFSLGAGADVYVMKKLFIRPTATFGIRLNQPKLIKEAKDAGVNISFFGHKFSIGLGVGYTL